MLTFLLTTKKGKILFHRSPYHGFFKHHNLEKIIAQEWMKGPALFITEIGNYRFFVQRRKFLFYVLWTLQEYSQELNYIALKKILTQYPWPACIIENKGRIIFANTQLLKTIGFSHDMLLGIEFQDLFTDALLHEEDFHTKIHFLKNVYNYQVPVIISHIVKESGYTTVFLFPAELKSILHGPSDLALLANIPMPAALLDENGTMHSINSALREKLPLSSPSLNQWISERDRQGFIEYLQKIRQMPYAHETFTIHMKHQEKKPFLVFAKYIPPVENYQSGYFLVIFTSSEELMSTESDTHKMQMLGQLASGIVHDFNNLLTGMLGFCDLLLQRHSSQEPSYKDIQQIKQSALRAARLTQQLLAFSKSTPPSQVPVSLIQCLKELFPLIHRIVGPKVILSLQEEDSKEKYVVFGDQGHLDQILLNLSINARDAMTESGSLTFKLYKKTLRHRYPVIKDTLEPNKYIVLDVIDTGSGIAQENIERIFEPFFSTKEQGQGTGLGLANVLIMMKPFQGGISIDTHPGKGTTFSLYFTEYQGMPVAEKNTVPRATRTLSASKTSTPKKVSSRQQMIRILLVEDEDPVRLFVARALRDKGYEVVEARDGNQALRFLQTHSELHIIVTDVMMPGIDGPALATAVKKMNPLTKILFVSGYPEEQVRMHLPASMSDIYFLPKPFALADLINQVNMLLEGRKNT